MQSDRTMDEILPRVRFLHIGLEYICHWSIRICLPSVWSITPCVPGDKTKQNKNTWFNSTNIYWAFLLFNISPERMGRALGSRKNFNRRLSKWKYIIWLWEHNQNILSNSRKMSIPFNVSCKKAKQFFEGRVNLGFDKPY